jgi:CubicO group peptidase (beta-lactamase class C family)
MKGRIIVTIELRHPNEVGLSARQLARIDEHLNRSYIKPGKIAGTLTLVARRGKPVYLSPLGSIDLARNRPMTEDTIFRIYSMTKPITSVAMMMLYEQGFFHLSDPVHRFIPEWRNLGVYSAGNYPNFITQQTQRPMTIRDLLTHTSGLTYGFMERTNIDAAYRRLDIGDRHGGSGLGGMIKLLAELPLEFSPGTHWNYSVSTDIVGYLVERISGVPFDTYLQDNILGPLGMIDTAFQVPPDKVDRLAVNYSRALDKKLVIEDDTYDSIYLNPPSYCSGGGGLVSTISDYFQFCCMLLNGGELDGVRILGPRTIDMMTMNHLPHGSDMLGMNVGTYTQVASEGFGFGLGFSVHLGSQKSQVIGSKGIYAWGGMASTAFWIDPLEELIVIFMTQFMPSGTFNFRDQLKAIIYPSIKTA